MKVWNEDTFLGRHRPDIHPEHWHRSVCWWAGFARSLLLAATLNVTADSAFMIMMNSIVTMVTMNSFVTMATMIASPMIGAMNSVNSSQR